MDDRFGLVGLRLADKYDVHEVVARGGFGLVYHAVHATLNIHVAIKVLMVPQELNEAAQESFMQAFLQEAQLIALLNHPAIVRVLDSGVGAMPNHEMSPWMALDWVDGQSLDVYLKSRKGKGGTAPEEALAFLYPVFSALAYAHEQGLAHRDVKPANIMLPRDALTARRSRHAGSGLRLLDFGIAKMMAVDERAGDGHTRTRSHSITYSPLWAAPEQVGSSRTGPWTDVHALALILVHVLTDLPPFAAPDQTELFGQVLSPQRPTPAHVGVDVGAWEPVLAKALALRPADRYPSVGDFLNALEETLPQATFGHAIVEGTQMLLVPPSAPATETMVVPIVQGTTLDPREVSQSPRATSPRAGWIALAIACVLVGAIGGLGVWTVATRAPTVQAPPAVVHVTPRVVAPVVVPPLILPAAPVVAPPTRPARAVTGPVVAPLREPTIHRGLRRTRVRPLQPNPYDEPSPVAHPPPAGIGHIPSDQI